MYFAKELNAQLCVEFANNKFQEQLWCTVRGGNDETVLVGCIYRSPSSDDQNNTELFNMLKSEKMSKFNKICIFGDFNFPDVNWDGIWNGNKSNEIIENFRDALLIQKVTNTTRFREGQKRTMDDLVFVNEESSISDIEYGHPLGKSDHLFLSFELYVPKVKTKENSKYKFNLQKGDYNKMRVMFTKNIEPLLKDDQEIEEMWNVLKQEVVKCMDICIPKTKCNQNKKCTPLWMNDKVLKKIKKKSKLFQRYSLTKDGKDYSKYAKMRNESKNLIKSTRKAYERKIAEECKNNPKSFWKYVQKRTKVNTGINTLKTGKGDLAESDMEKAEALNEYFASVFAIEDKTNTPDFL